MQYKREKITNISDLMGSTLMPDVTVLIPVYNEEEFILQTIYSVLNSDYKNVYITIINGGSTDNTLNIIISEFNLYPIAMATPKEIKTQGNIHNYYISNTYKNIVLIDKSYADKSDNLNAALNFCVTPLYLTVDADTLIEKDAISKIIFYMIKNPHTVIAGGAVYILNGCIYKKGEMIEPRISRNPIYGFQTTEYMRSFLFNRTGWNMLGGALCYSGTFTLFQYDPVLRLGGYQRDNLAQDFEVVTHIQAASREKKYPYKVSYTPLAAVWTDAPGNLKSYWRQRFNWQYGILLSLDTHKKMLLNPHYGIVGLFTYPFYLFGETFGAVVEFTAYVCAFISWYTGIINLYWLYAFLLICWGFFSFITMATVVLHIISINYYKRTSDLIWIIFLTVIENFGFRQFSVTCRLYATLRYYFDKIFKIKNSWFYPRD